MLRFRFVCRRLFRDRHSKINDDGGKRENAENQACDGRSADAYGRLQTQYRGRFCQAGHYDGNRKERDQIQHADNAEDQAQNIVDFIFLECAKHKEQREQNYHDSENQNEEFRNAEYAQRKVFCGKNFRINAYFRQI